MSDDSKNIAAPLSGFEKIQRYWDSTRNITVAKIQPGEFYVTRGNEAISTILGSCVAACVRDVDLGVGGMNHFMLPIKKDEIDRAEILSNAARYGNWAMEYLINAILKTGGRRRCLEVKLFGGGHVMHKMNSAVGAKNVEFVEKYVYDENLNVKAKDLGGNYARNIIYYPKTGVVQVKEVVDGQIIEMEELENKYFRRIDKNIQSGSVELF